MGLLFGRLISLLGIPSIRLSTTLYLNNLLKDHYQLVVAFTTTELN